jgi:uncharacterized protein (UPF0332 family)
MTLEIWHNSGWLREHNTSREEVQNLFGIIERDLSDAKNADLTNDWQFAIAYNACLQCCTIPLYCEGYRHGQGQSHHYRTISTLSLTMGKEYKDIQDYLNACRAKRNTSDYDLAGTISHSEAFELIETAEELYEDVRNWVKINYPEYVDTNK